MKANDPLLSVKGLKKYFPVYSGFFRKQIAVIKAVDGIDFAIESGKVMGLVGESGCGKSTAARTAIRLIEPTEGEITFLGEDFRAFGKNRLIEARRSIQIVFQDPYSSLNPRKTIRQSIGEALLYHQLVLSQEEMIGRVAETLKQVGLSPDAMDLYPHQFSGGQQQRICIGRSIAMRPKLIVCDEAVSALDVSVQAQILNLLMELKETLHLSYFFISHDLSVVRHLCDDVAVMHNGKIVEKGSVDQIFEQPQDAYTKKLLAAIPISHPRKRANLLSYQT
jgi:ABC-type oligopeptide transport system ATPase subunit